MRIYNGTKSSITMPLVGSQKLTIHGKSVSENFVGTIEFISLLVTSYGTDELAIIVGGPFELSVCARVPVSTQYVVQSLEEAIERFAVKEEPKVEPKPEPVKTEIERVIDEDPEDPDAVEDKDDETEIEDHEEDNKEAEKVVEAEKPIKTRKKVTRKKAAKIVTDNSDSEENKD